MPFALPAGRSLAASRSARPMALHRCFLLPVCLVGESLLGQDQARHI